MTSKYVLRTESDRNQTSIGELQVLLDPHENQDGYSLSAYKMFCSVGVDISRRACLISPHVQVAKRGAGRMQSLALHPYTLALAYQKFR